MLCALVLQKKGRRIRACYNHDGSNGHSNRTDKDINVKSGKFEKKYKEVRMFWRKSRR